SFATSRCCSVALGSVLGSFFPIVIPTGAPACFLPTRVLASRAGAEWRDLLAARRQQVPPLAPPPQEAQRQRFLGTPGTPLGRDDNQEMSTAAHRIIEVCVASYAPGYPRELSHPHAWPRAGGTTAAARRLQHHCGRFGQGRSR